MYYTIMREWITCITFRYPKVVRLEDENVVLKEKLEKETEENIGLKESIPKLEKMISERDAKIDHLTTVNRALTVGL